MNDSLTPSQTGSKSTRVDQAHEPPPSREAEENTPWMAMAGRDEAVNSEQLDRQTNELLAYVQRQNDEIDSRQAELNARLAQLDNEMRAARLRGSDIGSDLLNPPAAAGPAAQPASTKTEERPPFDPDELLGFEPEPAHVPSLAEFDEVERIVAQYTEEEETVSQETPEPSMTDPYGPPESIGVLFPPDTAPLELSESGVDINAMAASLDAGAIESERRLLAERKNELDRRKAVLQRMQDETQGLHREALEMRVVTEQLWSRLSEQAPADHLNELLSSLRGRLDEHYALMNKTLADRKSELSALRRRIQEKQDALRDQSHKLQEWVDSRHDQIKTYASQLDAREMLLDRREHRLQEEFSKWEAQRRTYKQQLQGLLKKLNLAGLAE